MKCYIRLKNNYIYSISYSVVGDLIKDEKQIEKDINIDLAIEITKYNGYLIYNTNLEINQENLKLYNRLQELYNSNLFFDKGTIDTYLMLKEAMNFNDPDKEQYLKEQKEIEEIRSKIDYYYILDKEVD